MRALCGQAMEMVEMVSESMRSDLIPAPRPSHTDFICAVTSPTMFAMTPRLLLFGLETFV